MKKRKLSGAASVIILAYIAFISLGLPDGLLGVAWPGIRTTFKQSLDAVGFLLVFSTSGYMLSSFFSGTLVRKLGVGGLLSLSCAATATALLTYSVTPLWILFFPAAFTGGLGAGAIDAGLNTYVEKHYSERMMQWLHASFGIGITSGPVIMTMGISITGKWRVGYVIVGLAQLILAVSFFLSRNKWERPLPERGEDVAVHNEASMAETLKKIRALLGMVMFFIYVGVELGFGLWTYSLLTISRGISPSVAGFITGSYWGMFTVGRILAGWYSRTVPVRRLLYISFFSAVTGITLVALNLGSAVTIGGIALTGFSIAPIFPSLISDTVNRVGDSHVANTIGMQIASAGLGGAVVPSIAGVLAARFSLEVIPFYMLIALGLLLIAFTFSHPRRKAA